MLILSLAIPIGVTMGIATWAVIRGRGGVTGLLLCAFFAMVGAILGGLGLNAIYTGGSRVAVAVGSLAGALLACLVEGIAFGPRPKRVAWVDQKGVAVSQGDDGNAPKTLV
jgi:hypothetical protein